MDLSWVVKKPLISEKAMSQDGNTYTFLVDGKATKGEIKEAIKQFLGKRFNGNAPPKPAVKKRWCWGSIGG